MMTTMIEATDCLTSRMTPVCEGQTSAYAMITSTGEASRQLPEQVSPGKPSLHDLSLSSAAWPLLLSSALSISLGSPEFSAESTMAAPSSDL